MKFYLLCISILLATLVQGEEENCNIDTIKNEALRLTVAFEKAGIVDDILPEAPTGLLKVSFQTVEVNLGNCIYTVRTILPPKVEYEDTDPNTNFTLAFWNLDVPSRVAPLLRSYLMFLAVNINGRNVSINSGDKIASWINASPTVKSGKHRILAVLYPQTCYIDPMDRVLIDLGVFRLNLNLEELVTNFTLGAPVAGNYWQTTIPNEEDKYWKLDHTNYCTLDRTEYCKLDHTEYCKLDHTEYCKLDHTEYCKLDHTEYCKLDHTENCHDHVECNSHYDSN